MEAWAERVRDMRGRLGWPQGPVVAQVHGSGAALAFAAPEDQLYTATELNEWAWQAGAADLCTEAGMTLFAPGHAAIWEGEFAAQTLRAMACAEQRPALVALLHAAAERGLPTFMDDDLLSLGAGEGSHVWPMVDLPAPQEVPWDSLHDIPTALVTGSNGKTTTVRLVAAMGAEQRWSCGYNCTDGIFVGGECVEPGDYSGPGGARTVLRHAKVQAAVLEVARGGILRRGLAVHRAKVALVTNISPDHFGEYGVHSLADLADAKLVVARALGPDGLLVINADDVTLEAKCGAMSGAMAWFALEDSHPKLVAHRLSGGSTCGVAKGRLRLHHQGATHDLGSVASMPLTVGGAAAYNIANAAAAALVATALGIQPAHISAVLARFGASRFDNPGRLERWTFEGLTVLMDYAHNPEGLAGLLSLAAAMQPDGRGGGRLGLLLGQAGNRDEAAIRSLARTAAVAGPDLVVLKDLDAYLRGREPGEVPAILKDELLRCGRPEGSLVTLLPELVAARFLLDWARRGDVLVLPVHSLAARESVAAWLDALQSVNWKPGDAFPESS